MTATSTIDKERIALFPGTFQPFTIGHADIVRRGLDIFDRIIIAVGVNKTKPIGSADDTVAAIRNLYKDEPRVSVEAYSSLTVDYARQCGATFLLRGVRSVKDFEYERDMAEVNSHIAGIETVILFSRPELSAISSTVVRELETFGHDISSFLPQGYKR